MPILSSVASLALAGALQSPAACSAPVFPARSTTADSVRRVQAQWKAWERCTAAHPASAGQQQEVEAAAASWLQQTRQYADGVRQSGAVSGRLAEDARRFELALRDQCGPGQPARANGCR